MEHTSWLWRKKTSEKTITSGDRPHSSQAGNEQQKERASELEKSLEDLNEQLSSACAESNAKDDILAKQAKVAEEAITGWEKAEAEASYFKQELDHALGKKAAAAERIASMDATLKECMLQLQIMKEEKQQVINDALMKESREQENARVSEVRLAEANKNLVKLAAEYNNVCKLLEVKEKEIEDLNENKIQLEANLSAIVGRLDTSEKDNAGLRYEICMLQKELDMRSEVREFNLKSADAAHKQHVESLKKITKLETECQRLRIMVRKRLPGPGALVKMRSEVEILGNSNDGTRRKKSNSATNGFASRDIVAESDCDISSKNVAFLGETLHTTKEENTILKEALSKKNSELETLRSMFACTASKLSHAELQLEESPKGPTCIERARYSPVSSELPLASISEDRGNDDNISCAESWASALISELEHCRNGKPKTQSCLSGVSDLSLMDDFAEMERLALVCVDSPVGSSNDSSAGIKTCMTNKETDTRFHLSEATGRELVPVDYPSGVKEPNCKMHSNCDTFEKYPSWLQDILKIIIQKQQTMQVNLDFILKEVAVALRKEDHPAKGVSSGNLCDASTNSQKPQHIFSHEVDEAVGMGIVTCERSDQPSHLSFEKSVYRLVELVEDIIQRCLMNDDSRQMLSGHDGRSYHDKKSPSVTEYIARVFLLQNSELTAVLRRFIMACKNMLYGKSDLKNFFDELTSSLDWIINHCFSLQDVSNMEESIKKRFDGDASHSDDQHEAAITTPLSDTDTIDADRALAYKNETFSPLLPTSNQLYILSRMGEMEDLETASSRNRSFVTRIRESVESISNLQVEPGKLKESNEFITEQVQNRESIKKDLDTKVTVAKVESSEAHKNFSTIEAELDEKTDSCDKAQESVAPKIALKCDIGKEEKQFSKEWEISSASVKLAECQETILNLGKQLKALASPKDAALFDKVISSPVASRAKRRILLDHMHEDDDSKSEEVKSPQNKEIIRIEPREPATAPSNNPNVGMLYGRTILAKSGSNDTIPSIVQTSSPANSPGKSNRFNEINKQGIETEGTLAIVPKKQKGGVNFLRKLLSRRKKGSSKKMNLTYY